MGTASHTMTSGDGLSHAQYLGKIMKPEFMGPDGVNRDLHECIHEMRTYLNEIDQKYVDGDDDQQEGIISSRMHLQKAKPLQKRSKSISHLDRNIENIIK